MFTTTITLPKELYRDLQHLALDEDVAVRGLIEEAIRQYLSRKKGGGKKWEAWGQSINEAPCVGFAITTEGNSTEKAQAQRVRRKPGSS